MVAALIDTTLADPDWLGDGRSRAGRSREGRSGDGRSGEGRFGDGRYRDGRSARWGDGSLATGVAVETALAGKLTQGGLVGEVGLRPEPSPRPVRSPSVPSAAVIRRRRLLAGAVAGAILLGLFLGLQALFGRPGGGPLASVGSPAALQPAVARMWVVHPGDTLWSIALACGVRGDIRPLVARLSAEVGGRPLQPGQRILVP